MTLDDMLSQSGLILKGDMQAQIKEVLEKYKESNQKDENPIPVELERLLREAASFLDAPYPEKGCPNLIWSDVLSLGRPAGAVSEAAQETAAVSAKALAYALATDGNSFALRYSNDKLPRFAIGLQEKRNGTGLTPSRIAESILRSACRYAKTAPSEPIDEDTMLFTSYAVCQMYFMDNNASEQSFWREKAFNWIDNVAAACPGRRYSVTLRFVPIKADWINKMLVSAQHLQSWLETYSETSYQSSGNVNYNEDSDPVTAKLLPMIFKGLQGTGSFGMGASLSHTLRRTDSHALAEQLRYLCARLTQMRRSGGYAVSIVINAEKEPTMVMVKSVVSGVFGVNGINLRWTKADSASRPLLLPVHGLDLLVSTPQQDFAGFSLRDIEDYEIPTPSPETAGVRLGTPYWNETLFKDAPFIIPYKELNRHAFVCGMTGSGKSNTTCCILSKMDRPFIVIEPVKGEYRSLKGSLKRDTRIYSMNVSSDEILSINPLWFPEGGNLQYHIDSIKAIISSAFDLYAAMPNILEQCLLRVYVQAGWNLITNRNIFEGRLPSDWLYPTIGDLCAEIERYLNNSEFEGEAKANYKGALLSRLQSFTSGSKGVLLNVPVHIPVQEWIEKDMNVVIELDALADDADKCIVMGTILTQYYQYVKYCTLSGAEIGLKHIMVLEEAHHLFAADDSSSDGNDSRKQLVSMLSNMLAEIRAYGEGVIIVDQSPTRISPEVIKNTAVKIIHRVDYVKDIEILRDALLLREEDKTISRLNQGQALVRFGNMSRPAMVQVERCEEKEAFKFQNSASQVNAGCLIQSVKDIVLMNEVFRLELTQMCKLFLNQALFDELPAIRQAYTALRKQILMFIKQHGYQELVQSVDAETGIGTILLSGIQLATQAMYPDQKYLCGIIRMYAERWIALEAQGGMNAKEWSILKDYRAAQIQNRQKEYYMTNMRKEIVALRTITPPAAYFGVLSDLIGRTQELKQILKGYADTGVLTAASEANARALIKQNMGYCFYYEPHDHLQGLIESILIQYYKKA